MFFKKNNLNDKNDEIVKVGALLIHAAKIDEDYSQKEAEIIRQALLKIGADNKDIEKIILCDVQKDIYPNIETSFLNLLHNSGYPEVKFEKKIDFEKLYSQRFN